MNKPLRQQLIDLDIPVTTKEKHMDEMFTYVSSALSQGKILDTNAQIIGVLSPLLLGILMSSLVTFAALLGVVISGIKLSIIFGVIMGLLTTGYVAFAIFDLAFQGKSKQLRLGFLTSLVSMFTIFAIVSTLAIFGSKTDVLLSALGGFLLFVTVLFGEFLIFKKYGARGSFRSGSTGGYEKFTSVPEEIASYVQKIKNSVPHVTIYLTSGRSGIYKPFTAVAEKECVLYYYVVNIGDEYEHIEGFWPEQCLTKKVAY